MTAMIPNNDNYNNYLGFEDLLYSCEIEWSFCCRVMSVITGFIDGNKRGNAIIVAR